MEKQKMNEEVEENQEQNETDSTLEESFDNAVGGGTENKEEKKEEEKEGVKLFGKWLPCKLESDELLEKGRLLSELYDEKARVEADKKAKVAEFSEHIKQIGGHIAELAKMIRNKEEFREVQCKEEGDYHTRKVRTTRLDTKEIIKERDMTQIELQEKLF